MKTKFGAVISTLDLKLSKYIVTARSTQHRVISTESLREFPFFSSIGIGDEHSGLDQ